MKKQVYVLAVLFCITVVFSARPPPIWQKTESPNESGTGNTFVLPASLTTIEDEAFLGTLAETVLLSDEVVWIGERAFAGSSALKVIDFPDSVAYIADHAFEGVEGLVIKGNKNSYAFHWAQEHNVAFVQETVPSTWIKKLGELLSAETLIIFTFISVCPGELICLRRRYIDIWRSMRPQDRPELYPINYRFP